MTFLTPGRLIMVAANLMYSVGAFAADWSPTHVKNPRWPPHARFHNGQTMTLGVLLTAASMYYTFRECPDAESAKDSIFTAAVIGSMYCVAGLSAIWYPGSDWKDPEHGKGREQLYLFSALPVAVWTAYFLEVQRL